MKKVIIFSTFISLLFLSGCDISKKYIGTWKYTNYFDNSFIIKDTSILIIEKNSAGNKIYDKKVNLDIMKLDPNGKTLRMGTGKAEQDGKSFKFYYGVIVHNSNLFIWDTETTKFISGKLLWNDLLIFDNKVYIKQ